MTKLATEVNTWKKVALLKFNDEIYVLSQSMMEKYMSLSVKSFGKMFKNVTWKFLNSIVIHDKLRSAVFRAEIYMS